MASGSKKTFLARQCFSCKEVMPYREKICYCKGSVTVIRLPLDKRGESSSYYIRRQLFWMRKNGI